MDDKRDTVMATPPPPPVNTATNTSMNKKKGKRSRKQLGLTVATRNTHLFLLVSLIVFGLHKMAPFSTSKAATSFKLSSQQHNGEECPFTQQHKQA
jgi:hypothetical protein